MLLNFAPTWTQWAYQVLVAGVLYGMREGMSVPTSLQLLLPSQNPQYLIRNMSHNFLANFSCTGLIQQWVW